MSHKISAFAIENACRQRVRSPAGSGAVGAFFLLVHGTKLGMFLRSDAREQRTLSKRKESSIAIAAPCADAGAAP